MVLTIILMMSSALNVEIKAALAPQEKKEPLNVLRAQDAMFVAVAILDNDERSANQYYNNFSNQIMSQKNIEYAITLLDSFYKEIIENIKTFGDPRLTSLGKQAGKQFMKLYQENIKQLSTKKKPSVLPAPSKIIVEPEARSITPTELEQVFLQDLKEQLPLLPLDTVIIKLTAYVQHNEKAFATAVVNFIEQKYDNPNDDKTVYNILLALHKLEENDTYLVVNYRLSRLYVKLIEKAQMGRPSVEQIKKRLGL